MNPTKVLSFKQSALSWAVALASIMLVQSYLRSEVPSWDLPLAQLAVFLTLFLPLLAILWLWKKENRQRVVLYIKKHCMA